MCRPPALGVIARHGNLDALIAEPRDTPRPLPFDRELPFELEAELAKERDRGRQVLDDDADVVHPLHCHATDRTRQSSGHTEAQW